MIKIVSVEISWSEMIDLHLINCVLLTDISVLVPLVT